MPHALRAISHWREYSPASRREYSPRGEYTIHIDAINIARDLWWSATINIKWCLLLVIARLYTVNHKKRDILFLTITLANLNRFL